MMIVPCFLEYVCERKQDSLTFAAVGPLIRKLCLRFVREVFPDERNGTSCVAVMTVVVLRSTRDAISNYF